MACSPHTCTNHNTGTTTCGGHRASCATNRSLSIGTDAVAGTLITASDIDAFRTNLRAEIDAYNNHRWYSTAAQTEASAYTANSTEISAAHLNNLSAMTDALVGGGIYQRNNTYEIDDYDWDVLLTRYNTIRQNCVCNSDCACNNVCACHGDCGCNYASDIRLKENIQYLETRNGIRIYSWNYIWNKSKTFIGVMAQEILKTKHADAITTDINGFYMVNYNKLPI